MLNDKEVRTVLGICQILKPKVSIKVTSPAGVAVKVDGYAEKFIKRDLLAEVGAFDLLDYLEVSEDDRKYSRES